MAVNYNFEAMSVDALWQLHEELRVVLATRLTDQRQELDERLRDLEQIPVKSRKTILALQRKAGPTYRNPKQPAQIWSGRGLRPRWLVLQLAAGRPLEEFQVDPDCIVPTPADEISSPQQV